MYQLLALAHAIPVFIVAVSTNSKPAVIGTAIIMGLIGALTGSPLYIGLDLAAVSIGAWLSLTGISNTNSKPSNKPQSKAAYVAKGAANDLAQAIIIFAICFAAIGAFVIIYNRFIGECSDSKIESMGISFQECRALKRAK
jgi:multisubunit Na+/H+ antiporter MnhC subunit